MSIRPLGWKLKITKAETLFCWRGYPVVLQWLDDEYCNYCIQYGGGGHYFKTLDEAREYIRNRWKCGITF